LFRRLPTGFPRAGANLPGPRFAERRPRSIATPADATPDVVAAVLGEGAKFAEEVLQPLNRVGDIEGCTRHDDGSVTTPTGFKEAYRDFAAGGWIGLSAIRNTAGRGCPTCWPPPSTNSSPPPTWPSACIPA
jgi:hypothetical protein